MKFIIILVIFYLVYKSAKSWMNKILSPNQTVSGGMNEEIDDVMVKDPYCEVYFPQRKGYPYNFKGEQLYFCSKECKEKFIADKT